MAILVCYYQYHAQYVKYLQRVEPANDQEHTAAGVVDSLSNTTLHAQFRLGKKQ